MALIPDDTRVSDCEGRVGAIIDTARDLFNETAGGFLVDAFILRSINRCQQDIAQDDTGTVRPGSRVSPEQMR